MFGEDGSEALQLCDNSQVDFHVISPAADTPAEIYLHAAHATAECLRVFPARLQRDDVAMTGSTAPFFFFKKQTLLETRKNRLDPAGGRSEETGKEDMVSVNVREGGGGDTWKTQGLLEDSGLGEQLLLVHFSPLMDLAVFM